MMERILADTNAFGYLQQNNPTAIALLNGKQVFVSELTEMELLCNPNLSKAERRLRKAFSMIATLSILTNKSKK